MFSPEGLVILPFAAIIDIVGIILVCFALDDFWITDIIAWSVIGLWGMFRSQITPTAEVQMPSVGEKQKIAKDLRTAQKTTQETEKAAQAAKKAQKTAKAAKWAKNIKWLEFIPYVGALPFWTISVYMTIKYS